MGRKRGLLSPQPCGTAHARVGGRGSQEALGSSSPKQGGNKNGAPAHSSPPTARAPRGRHSDLGPAVYTGLSQEPTGHPSTVCML